MKNIILTLIIAVTASLSSSAIEIDTLWYRTMGAGAQDVDFTPDDRYVIAWANGIEFWEVEQGVKEFFIPSEATGDFNFDEQYLVFVQDSTPKLLDWKTKEVIEGFQKEKEHLGRIRTAKSKNEFMATKGHHPKVIYFWDINQKMILDSFEVTKEFIKDGQNWGRSVHEYDYLGNNDEFFYVRINDNNAITPNLPPKNQVDNFSYLIYSRETKQIVDSLFAFQLSDDKNDAIDKLVVMNDRSKIAWNNKGGEINFYDFNQKYFYNKLIFSSSPNAQLIDLELEIKSNTIGLTEGLDLEFYNFDTKEKIFEFTKSSWQYLSFSDDGEFITANHSDRLILIKNPSIVSNIEGNQQNVINLNVTPNPASNSININFHSLRIEPMKLSIIDLVGNEIVIIEEGILNNQHYIKDYNISNLPSGAYFIRLEISGDIITQQFIKVD